MTERVAKFSRALLWALPVWAVMLLIGTLTHQPDTRTQFGAWSEYVTTDWFLISHLANSILGAAIGSLGFVGLFLYLSETKAMGRAGSAMIAFVLGNTITAAVFGVAAFAQPAVGRSFLSGNQTAEALYNDIYAVPLFASVSLGLLLFIAGGVLGGLAIAASGRLPAWTGWVLVAAVPIFALANIFLPAVLQTVASVALVSSTLVIAWTGMREERSHVAAGRAAHA